MNINLLKRQRLSSDELMHQRFINIDLRYSKCYINSDYFFTIVYIVSDEGEYFINNMNKYNNYNNVKVCTPERRIFYKENIYYEENIYYDYIKPSINSFELFNHNFNNVPELIEYLIELER